MSSRTRNSTTAVSASESASDISRRAIDSPRITYVSRPDTTPEAESIVLANVYRFILDCNAKKLATEPASESDGHDDHEMFRQGAKEANMT